MIPLSILDLAPITDASGLWFDKVVTEAEPEHQDYLQHYPTGYTGHFARPGWRLSARTKAAAG